MMATRVILAHLDGLQLPQWPFSISLNNLIALLSVFQRSALELVVAEIISHTKWSWFTTPFRPLSHLQRFHHRYILFLT
jgi:hypothetical protein